jgi:hypothetical protein
MSEQLDEAMAYADFMKYICDHTDEESEQWARDNSERLGWFADFLLQKPPDERKADIAERRRQELAPQQTRETVKRFDPQMAWSARCFVPVGWLV